jgi:hypothetical protein
LWHAREDRREAAARQPLVAGHISAIVFESHSRPGRRVRVTRYPSAISADKRNMRDERSAEAGLFD